MGVEGFLINDKFCATNTVLTLYYDTPISIISFYPYRYDHLMDHYMEEVHNFTLDLEKEVKMRADPLMNKYRKFAKNVYDNSWFTFPLGKNVCCCVSFFLVHKSIQIRIYLFIWRSYAIVQNILYTYANISH